MPENCRQTNVENITEIYEESITELHEKFAKNPEEMLKKYPNKYIEKAKKTMGEILEEEMNDKPNSKLKPLGYFWEGKFKESAEDTNDAAKMLEPLVADASIPESKRLMIAQAVMKINIVRGRFAQMGAPIVL